jgi:putative sterol carrier protein
MTFEEIYQSVKKRALNKAERTDMSKVGNVTVEVTLTGDSSGTFFASSQGGHLVMEPTACIKKDLTIILSAEDFEQILERKLNPMAALAHGRIKTKGNLTKVLQLRKLL